ncbi:MAG: class IV adenylate cyclase [Phycisphaeraceae bacterium]
MIIEIEAKMRLTEAEQLDGRLEALGARRGPLVYETNVFFDTPQGTLKAQDQGLRVRIERLADRDEPLTVAITHKGPRAHGQLKRRAETEVGVSDGTAAGALLKTLGYVQVFLFEKRRQKWELGGCHIAIDTLPYLGHFIEIEGPTEPAVLSMRQQLQLTAVPMIQASYIAMLRTYVLEHQLPGDQVRFAGKG